MTAKKVKPVVEAVSVTDALDVAQSSNVLAAWRGLEQLFGAKVESWNITPEGPIAIGFTVDDKYDVSTILEDISSRNRQVPLVPSFFYINGQPSTSFSKSIEMTIWMQQYFRKVGEDHKKSPAYVKTAIAEYKLAGNFPRKGRPRRTIRTEQLGSLDETMLEGVSIADIEKLQGTLASVAAARKAS